MHRQHKYARVERERRFLLAQFPTHADVLRVRRIQDRYLDGARLRLREQSDGNGPPILKLTQKIWEPYSGAQQGYITTIYLNQDEFCALAQLPAKKLSKTRHSVPPFGIDVFENELEGLLIAEAEFESGEAADALDIPPFLGPEVSLDIRFTGGRLVAASREELRAWLSEYGITLRGEIANRQSANSNSGKIEQVQP